MMNESKISFISCVNDQELYSEALYYINQLEVPQGYEIECISVENADSMTRGYNEAMKASDAKYKVYLHQDVYIVNKSFIKDILTIFNSNDNLGMLGVVGAKVIPTNAMWWESKKKYGKVYDSHAGEIDLLSFDEVSITYETVQAIDGLIMITQYDIPWREDIFDGWHFYDLSQSVEFIKAGYEVAISKQEKPWVINDCGIVNVRNGYENYRKLFLEEYSKDIFPLVSILIPTYNRPKYFRLALDSALNQTYQNIEIIVGDDSTNNETEELIRKYYLKKYSNIKYYHNEKNLGQFDNDIKLFDMAKGKYINFLMDDDAFEETKIEKMMNYFVYDEDQEISLVTSHRAIIDDKGNNKGIFGSTDKVFKKDTIIDGIELGNFVLMNNYNCIGEPTTVLFRKDKLTEPFGVFNKRRYGCNVDQASWFNLLAKGKAAYINEVLSYFRLHKGQQQNDNTMRLKGLTDYLHEILTCQEKGFLKASDLYLKAINNCLAICKQMNLISSDFRKVENIEYLEFKKYYNDLKNKFSENYNNLVESKLSNRIEDEKQKIMNDFEYDYTNDLFIKKNYVPINYADGSEKYIVNVFEKVRNIDNDSSNNSFPKYIRDWPSKYHLSQLRTNVFESIKDIIENKESALELGAGMGAVTQWLAENCKNIDVIEGSIERAKANRLRNKFNSYVQIFVDDLSSMTFPKSCYDLATLIGVLEYIPFYTNGESPEQACISFLKKVSENLAEDGLLVIAIENKLGAKYFSGCAEDHNGQLFSGIHGYPEKSPITFSRFEIKNILESAGFKKIQFYHCFPDYKMSKVVLQENERVYDLSVASIARGIFIDHSNQREFLLCDPLLIDTLTKSRLLHEFSNSFLIICSKSEVVNLKTNNLGVKFWNDDSVKDCYHHKIEFIERQDGIYVERKPFGNGSKKVEKENLSFILNNEIMIEGEILSLEAYRYLIRKDNYISLIRLIKELREFIIKEFSTDKIDNEGYLLLKGESIDCCFNNIVRCKDKKLVFIDRKWRFKNNIQEDYVIFRSLWGLFNEMYPYIFENSLSQFIIPIMNNIYPNYDSRRFDMSLEQETIFQKDILLNPSQIKDSSISLANKSFQYKQLLLNQLIQQKK